MPEVKKVLASCDIKITAEVAEDRTKWVQVFAWGEVRPVDGRGPWYLYEQEAEAVKAAWQVSLDPQGRLVDYEHASVKEYFWSEQPLMSTRASGWAKEVEVFGPGQDPVGPPAGSKPGAWLKIRWTPAAAQMIRDEEYTKISAVFWVTEDGHLLSIEGAGLTNTPAIVNMESVAAKKQADRNGNGTPREGDMGWKETAKDLGIEADTEEAFRDRIKELQAKAAATPPPLPAPVAAPVAADAGPSDSEVAATKRAEEAEQKLAKIEAEKLIDGAIAEGKLDKATRAEDVEAAAANPEWWAARIAKLPARRDGQTLPPQGRQGASAGESQVPDGPVVTAAASCPPNMHLDGVRADAARVTMAEFKDKLSNPEYAGRIRAAAQLRAAGG